MTMHTGKIKKIIVSRGFGFISARDGREVFFHQNGLLGIKFEELKSDQHVEFEVEKSAKGPTAFNIRVMAEQESVR